MRSSAVATLMTAAVSAILPGAADPASAQDFDALRETRPPDPLANVSRAAPRRVVPAPRVLIAGDSWAQYMWDDGSHNDIFDRYGHDDHRALSRSLQSNPGPGYSGPEYAVSGSEAREWANTAEFPWIANVVAELDANPTIDTVLLSIGGNDILRGRSGGGWYKDMDLDLPGSEAALFDEIHDDTFTIIDAILAVRPDLRVVISSYDYPNFNVGFWCFIYACPKRRDLSRDPETDLITDEELNSLMITVETLRIDWANAAPRVDFDNGIGAMHHFYGDGQSPPGVLPLGGQEPPLYTPFPGGNPLLPTLRENFRRPGGIDADPLHRDREGDPYTITHTTNGLYFPHFRGQPDATFLADGGDRDGWTDGVTVGTSSIVVGDDGGGPLFGIVSFDTSALPDDATVTGASFYLVRHDASGSNPFMTGSLGLPTVDVARGGFGAPELEPADATAPATVADAGMLIGSVRADGYALRVDLAAGALEAIDLAGLTQFRLAFPGVNAGADAVAFRDGDGGATGGAYPALAEFMGSSAPFLDVTFEQSIAAGETAVSGNPLRLHQNMPNPFRASTSLQVSLERSEQVRLAVYDVTGRMVRTLVDERLPQGTHNRVWDGRDTQGRRVAAGVYFAELAHDGGRETVRMVRVDE